MKQWQMTGSKSTYFYQGCFRPNLINSSLILVCLLPPHSTKTCFQEWLFEQLFTTKYKSFNSRKFTTVDFCLLIWYTLQKLHSEANMGREIVNEYIFWSLRKKYNLFILSMMLKRPDQEENRHTWDYTNHKCCCLLVGN